MKKIKRVIQYALPTDVEYEIIESYYNGGIESGGECCENCGRFISNVAVIKSKYGSFHVGMDCAETLSGIKDSFSFEYEHKARFSQAKQARATLLKAIKAGAVNVNLKTYEDDKNFYKEIGAGRWEYERRRENGAFDGYNWKQYPAITWNKYVMPMLQNLTF